MSRCDRRDAWSADDAPEPPNVLCEARFEEAAGILGGELQDAIAEFRSQMYNGASAIERAEARSDPEDVRRLAHHLLGSSTLLGADRVSELCREVQRVAGLGDVADLVADLRRAVAAAHGAMRRAASATL